MPTVVPLSAVYLMRRGESYYEAKVSKGARGVSRLWRWWHGLGPAELTASLSFDGAGERSALLMAAVRLYQRDWRTRELSAADLHAVAAEVADRSNAFFRATRAAAPLDLRCAFAGARRRVRELAEAAFQSAYSFAPSARACPAWNVEEGCLVLAALTERVLPFFEQDKPEVSIPLHALSAQLLRE